MAKKILLLLTCVTLLSGLWAQEQERDYGGTYYGFKGGLTLGTQKWNDFDREALASYHGILTIEGIPAQGQFSLWAQLGYHVKGSTIRSTVFGNPFNAGLTRVPPQKFEFYNLSLSIGAKQVIKDIGLAKMYYLFGIRGDYTLDTNLDEYKDFTSSQALYAPIYPIDSYEFIRRINYGAIVGGGFSFPLSELIEGLVEFTVNPDFSLQYKQPAIPNVFNPLTTQTTTIRERNIRNLTFEITVGARFLRKVEYID